MPLLKSYQTYFLFASGMVCILQAIYLTIVQVRSIAKKRSLILLELCIGILLIADAFAYIYRGNPTQTGWWMVRISNFIVFFNTSLSILLFNMFLTYFIMETAAGRIKKVPTRLIVGYIIPSVAMTLLVISQFTDLYYYFDPNNFYHRNTLYPICFLLPYVTVGLMISVIFSYRKYFSVDMLIAVISFTFLPIAAGVVQLFVYGFSFINISLFISACIVFSMVLSDQNKKLAMAADTEIFSGLPNATGFTAAVDKVIHYKDITAFDAYYFDIKGMGFINEKYGKETGDEILIVYSHNIRKLIDADEIVGRLGGNFFVALIKKSNTEKFLKLLSDVNVEIKVSGKKQNVHVSSVAGIYRIKSRRIAAGQLIGNCATALSYAKNTAHLPYVYMDDELEEKFRKNHEIEAAAKVALVKNEFEPFYQPKVDSRTNEICGAEALVRWRHDGKLVSPGEFLGVLEKNRDICDVDFYILNRVCKDLSGWIVDGLNPVCVSVNFSRRNLEDPQLAKRINDVVESYNISKDLIQVEITETIDEYPMSVLRTFIDHLHQFGFKAAIDDFGIGSSSINLLKSVNFDVLKIDKAFVDSYDDPKDKVLLRDIISLAHDVGIATVAEGVEEKDQLEVLKEMNCFVIQGYVYSKPVEKKVFEEKLKTRTFELG